ncbi:MAG: Uncharacterised protein [Synechococcus sp. CC9902]|nr:MAG: Uncharacterised protein [Synechococcus sp. CC9902]
MPEIPCQLQGISHHRCKIAMGLQLKDLGANVGM